MRWEWILLAVLVLLASAVVPLIGARRRQRLRSNDEAVAARARHAQLGHYVEVPPATDDEPAVLLFRRAQERWTTAGGALARARTEKDFELAADIAVEGLRHVAEAHQLLGLPVPPIDE